MPYTDAKLPFSGITPHARHASYLGAKKAEASVERLQADYLDALKAHTDGLTDAEAATVLGWNHASAVSARRNGLLKRGLVYSDGWRRNRDSGLRNTIWKAY